MQTSLAAAYISFSFRAIFNHVKSAAILSHTLDHKVQSIKYKIQTSQRAEPKSSLVRFVFFIGFWKACCKFPQLLATGVIFPSSIYRVRGNAWQLEYT